MVRLGFDQADHIGQKKAQRKVGVSRHQDQSFIHDYLRLCRYQGHGQIRDGDRRHDLGWGAKFGPEGSSIIGSPSGNPE